MTLKNKSLHGGYTVFGGVIFTKADRQDIETLADLKGKTFMAVDPSSFGGWIVALRELNDDKITQDDFSKLVFGGTHDAVVHAVLAGKIDAGTVRTDTLERMSAEGLIDIKKIKILHDNHLHVNDEKNVNGGFPYLRSTRLYPEWPFAQVNSTPDDLSQKVTIALLSMAENSAAAVASNITGWAPPQNYQLVHDCLKELKINPYEDYGSITIASIYSQYRPWLMTLFGAVIVILGSLTEVLFLNRNLKKTRTQLQDMNDTLESRVNERTRGLNELNSNLVGEVEERKQAQEQFQQAKEEWERTFDAIADIVCLFDPQMRIMRINRTGWTTLGAQPKELIGKYCYEVFHNAVDVCTNCPVPKAIQSLKPQTYEVEHTNLKKTFLVTASPVVSDEGHLVGVAHVAQDITEHKKLEARYLQAQKMESLGKLSVEWHTILTIS